MCGYNYEMCENFALGTQNSLHPTSSQLSSTIGLENHMMLFCGPRNHLYQTQHLSAWQNSIYRSERVVRNEAFIAFWKHSHQHPHPQPALVTSLLFSLKLSVTFSVNMGPPCLRMSSLAILINASSTLLESLAEVSMALIKSSWWAMACASANETSRWSVKSDLLPGCKMKWLTDGNRLS